MEELKSLNYQPADATRRHRNNRRAAIAMIVTAVVGSAIIWGPPGFHWVEFLYWQRRGLNYSQPPSHVVYEFNSLAPSFDPVPEERNFRGDSVFNHPIFLHERQRPDGVKRLVAFEFFGNWRPMGLCGEVWAPTWSSRPKTIQGTNVVSVGLTKGNYDHLKIYAGQTDPTDPTHFTFDYEMNGTHHTVDVRLTNIDRLVMSERP